MKYRVGELRPSQVLFSFGVGAIVDLPNISVMVMGLDEWDGGYQTEVCEERLLAAVRTQPGHAQVERLCGMPMPPDGDRNADPLGEGARIGLPMASFPRWMRCPACDLLAPLKSGLFVLKADPFHPDHTRYVHDNCGKSKTPGVIPARFLVACAHGHLDDFPWVAFVHRDHPSCGRPELRLREVGVSGAARDIWVRCVTCDSRRQMSDAFEEDGHGDALPTCFGRRPHLRDYAEEGCTEPMRAILLGASNSWFPVTLSLLSIPMESGKLAQLVLDHWDVVGKATSLENIELLRQVGVLKSFADFAAADIWSAVETHRSAAQKEDEDETPDLKLPEWRVFSQPEAVKPTDYFQLRRVAVPTGYDKWLSQIVLVEKLREVRTLLGFTRIESPGDYDDGESIPVARRAPITRKTPRWVPASEVRGEGIFIQFDEQTLIKWLDGGLASQRDRDHFDAHRQWRRARRIQPDSVGFPGIRYVLLHTFAHALMRQLALECGYTAASIRERIYARGPEADGGPMAGILIYTAAPDSEGTLGGLVNLGEPATFGRHLDQALEQMSLCASDPLCAEHHPHHDGATLHGAACHACQFAPETSCERGNKYLDRVVLVPTFGQGADAFFS